MNAPSRSLEGYIDHTTCTCGEQVALNGICGPCRDRFLRVRRVVRAAASQPPRGRLRLRRRRTPLWVLAARWGCFVATFGAWGVLAWLIWRL